MIPAPAYDPNNVLPARIWEDEHVLAFIDACPLSEGHVLVISKTSTACNAFHDVQPEVLARLRAAARRTARALVKALEPESFLIVQMYGAAGNRADFRLHYHVIPRWADLPLRGRGQAPMAEPETLFGLAGRIAAALD